MSNRTTNITAAVLALSLLLPGAELWAEGEPGKVFYRYVNSKGVKVLNHSIPPEYAQKGYEVVSLSGRVIKTVPPALSGNEAARLNTQRSSKEALAKWDAQLRRRYSRVEDIDAAKKRKLADLDGNISILRSNIIGTTKQLERQQAQAATFERQGRAIPEALLENIDSLQLELEDTEEQVRLRLLEYNEVAAKYDRDIERFKVIGRRR